MKEVVVIGGGASGLFSAINLKKILQENVTVTVVERLERVGKKILATGNGRCNFTNMLLSENKYNNPAFVKSVIKKFDASSTIAYFKELGLLERIDAEGRVYPASEMASSLLDVLRLECKRQGIIEKCNFDVKKITKTGNRFIVESTRGLRLNCDYVILAAGGKAQQVLGSNGSGYILAKSLKAHITDLHPGLVGARVDSAQIKGLDGVRQKGVLKLVGKKNKNVYFEKPGEVQFKMDGLSGIVVMEAISKYVHEKNKKGSGNFNLVFDLMPEFGPEELLHFLEERTRKLKNEPNETLFVGLFHKMFGTHIFKRCKIDLNGYISDLTLRDLQRIASEIKNMEYEIKEPYSFDRAQVTIGGIDIKDIIPETLELRSQEGVYVTGEIIDIDGECGGFNLQWAWSSAYVASTALAMHIK